MTALLDTNVLVYAFAPSDQAKHQRALALLGELLHDRELIVSVQVVNELTSVLLKRGAKLGYPQIVAIVADVVASSTVLTVPVEATLEALRGVSDHGLSFWDAVLWATARRHGVARIYTEDFQHGRRVEGVEFWNPFLDRN